VTEIAVIGYPSEGNFDFVAGLRAAGVDASLLSPYAAKELSVGDVGLVRLDVLRTLDGVEDGLEVMADLERRGIRIVNPPVSLLATHDKLRTYALLAAAGIPHPRTQHLVEAEKVLRLRPPVVLKPRFGSWGKDVWRCRDRDELRLRAEELVTRGWFRRHGMLAQELLPSPGYDFRLLVAGGRLVGAARRISAPGEWRTNVSVGGRLEPLVPPAGAVAVALRAAHASGADLVGVDVLPAGDRFIVLELNGTADFCSVHSLAGRDVYADLAAALSLTATRSAVRA